MRIILQGRDLIQTYEIVDGMGRYDINVPQGYRIRGGLESCNDGVIVFRLEREANQVESEDSDGYIPVPIRAR